MLTDWKNFLSQQGAVFEHNHLIHFGQPELEGEAAHFGDTITPLSYLSIIEVKGEDSTPFLNAQFTTDISQLTERNAQLSAWCNPKGRVISTFYIYRDLNNYFLLLPTELKEPFCKRLQMFVLRAAVTIEDRSDELVAVGIRSSNAGKLAEINNSMAFTVADHDKQRVIVFDTVAKIQSIWQSIDPDYKGVTTQHWQLFNVLAGIPEITPETSEQYLPQEINLDLIDALNFSKGCYPGQEIVARVRYRGQVKRRLTMATSPADHIPELGMKLYTEDDERSIGTVLNTSQGPDDNFLSLCVVDIDQLNADILHLGAISGPSMELQSLPYVVDVS